ncbi:MAG: cytochrome b [bacterium]
MSKHNGSNKENGFKSLRKWFTEEGFQEEIIERRLDINGLIKEIKKKIIPKNKINILSYPGWIALFLFIVEILTGILLMLYYHATVAEAYADVRYITNVINYGWLFRGIHYWGSHLMIIFVFLHMLQTFFYGGYKAPKELVWISGIILWIFTLLLGLTGYLLPWNQVSYWAVTVVTEVPMAFPYIGNFIKELIRGGADVSQVTLTRFYALHVVLIPLIVGIGLFFHLFAIRKHLVPRDLLTYVVSFILMFGLLLSLATLFPAPIKAKANPFLTPENVKPEWYFLASLAVLQYAGKLEFLGSWAPKLLGAIFQIIFILFLFCIPFIDRGKARAPRKRPIAISLGIFFSLGYIILTLLGHWA